MMDFNVIDVFPTCPEYPPLLLEAKDKPEKFWRLGRPLDPANAYIAIVGTRRPSLYGKSMAEKFSAELAQQGFTVVSGLAYGIDQIAHSAALDAGGKTVGVLGFGLSSLKTIYNKKLVERMIAEATIITEYEDDEHGTKFTFPERNRIIAGMSFGTLVIEAPLQSGALITARMALDYNREVFTIPSNITQESGLGSNLLIQKTLAYPVMSVADIFEYLNIEYGLKPENSVFNLLNGDEQILYSLLKKSPLHFEEIVAETEWPASRISSALTFLELKGYIGRNGLQYMVTRG